MERSQRIIRMAHDLRLLIAAESDGQHLRLYEELALALKPVLDELGKAGIVDRDVGLELNEYAQLKTDGTPVAEQYGHSVDIGLGIVDPNKIIEESKGS